jgi:hypothetical protein
MNRFVFALPLILCASLAAADSPRRLSIAEQAASLQQNLGLIRSVVGNSLSLAREEDRLKRADACSKTAADLCREIQHAADAGDSARAAELALHLRKLLTQGVSSILKDAHKDIPPGVSDEQRLREIQERTVNELRSLEEHLPASSTSDDLDLTIHRVREGRVEVEKAVVWPKNETEK